MPVYEYIKIANSKAGDVVGYTLYDSKSRVLIRAGNRLTEAGIRAIKEQGYKGIYIQHESTERREEIPVAEPLISEPLCIQIVNFLKDIVAKTDVNDSRFDPQFYVYRRRVEEYVQELVDSFFEHEENNTLLFETEDTRTYNTWLYYHSLNTCLLSIGIAIKKGLSKKETYEIALGAIFHDIGKMFIPRELVNKLNPTDREKAEIRKHCEIGYKLFTKYDYSINTRYAIWFHHEREDGSGYPNGVLGEKIPLAAKIVSLASTYDNMVNYNPFFANPMPQSEALEQICGDKRFDTGCVIALTQFVVPYPMGVRVKLSDGREGLVLKNVPGFPLRPILISGKEILNLAKDEKLLNLTITGV